MGSQKFRFYNFHYLKKKTGKGNFLSGFLAVLLLCCCTSGEIFGQRFAVASGNWNGAIWATTTGGVAGSAATPTSADAVTINSAISVTVNVPANCASLTYGTGGTQLVTISSTNSLTITGLLSIPRPTTLSTMAVGAGSLSCGSYTSTSTTAGRNSVISISTGTVTISGITTTTGGTGGIQFTFTDIGTLNFGGAVTGGATAAFTTVTGSTVNYSGGVQTLYSPVTYANLTLSGNGAKTFPTGAATINGILSIENGTNANTFTGTITYGAGATLQYNAGASARTVSTEWPATFLGTGGVIIKGTGAISLNGAKVLGTNTNVPLNINSGATLTPGANLITLHGDYINGGGTLTSGTGGVTITGTTATQAIAGFTTTGSVSFTKASGTATISGAVSAVNLTVNGAAGVLVLQGANTFSGTRTLTAGTLTLSNTAALGAAATALSLNGGTLDLATDASVNAYNITVGGAATIKSNKATTASAGIVHTLGTLSIGAFVLTTTAGANVASGVAGVTFGAVTHTGAPTYTVTDIAGSTTQLSVAAVTNSTFLTTFNGNGDIIQTGVFGNGSGGITYSGTGTLTLNQANTFTGVLTVSGGTVVGTANAAALGAGTLTLSGGTLNLTNTSGANLSFSRNTTLNAASTIITDVTATGAGNVYTLGTLANTGFKLTITGGANVTSGTAGVTFGAVTHTLVAPTYTVTDPTGGGVTQLSVAAVANSTFLTTFNGDGNVIQTGVFGNGSGGITYSGTGTLTLNQANTFTGVLTVSGGTVIGTAVAGALGAGSLTLSGGTLKLTNTSGSNLSFSRNTTVNAASVIITDVNATGAGNIYTLGTLANTGFQLTITGGANVNSGTAGVTFGAVTHTLAAPTYTVNDPVGGGVTQLSVAAVANSTFLTTFNGDGNIIQTGIFGNGSGGITYSGTGQLTLNQANTFTGILNVNGGTVVGTAVVGALGAGTLTLSGGTLKLTNTSGSNLSFSRNTTVSAASTIITDVTATGAGNIYTLGTLANTGFQLTITGGANVNSGTAGITFGAVTHTLAAPTYTVTDPTGGGVTQLSVAAVANSTFLTTFNGDGNVIQTGVFGNGSGGITYSGTGILTLNQTNTFTGGVTLNSGTLNINAIQALGAIAGTFTLAGGTIQNTTAGAITTLNYPMAWNGDFTFAGSQNLNLGTGVVTPSADRQVTVSGTALLTIGGIINAGTLSLVKAGTGPLSFVSQTITLKSVTISAGTLTSTSGTLNVSGDFTNSATFTHNSGTVTFNGAGAQAINSGGSSFNNFTITNTGGTCTAITNTITVATTFTTSASTTLDMGTNALSVATVAHSGTLLTQNTSATPITAAKTWGGTVQYNGASAQTIINGNYNNLDGTGGDRTLNSSGTIGVAAVFTPGAGTYTITGSTMDFNGTAAQGIPAFAFNNLTISANKAAGAVTFANGGTIGVAGIFSVTATNTSYVVTNNTFDFNGSGAQTITANASPFTTYNNLIISNAGTKTILTATAVSCLTFTINGSATLAIPGTAALTVTQ